ncbi:RING-H2 finger protein ATL67-like [Prosopis cineraria]|uniref:RING-H2 finger protein ATL67-like n=1 Tax=Prosopis cineraria TaxID=364024 RepID=UPI00241054DE|nr:RING-H2 finger protein ATL67-like [Prosopis cineraria]
MSLFINPGLGYSIAIALAFLVLASTLILSFYLCCRNRNRNPNLNSDPNPNMNPSGSNAGSEGIVLPRVIFVAEEEDDNESAVVGLDENVINSYPRLQYSRGAMGVGSSTMCSICLCEYRDSEILRMMPECRHYFHLWCLDAWLKLNGSCPVCRNSPLMTPISTPLQEVVPLSQYPADRRRRR